MFSRPANALTSIISVDSGVWKFVNIWSTTLNLKPGYIKMLVELVPALTHSWRSFWARPSFSANNFWAALSRVLTLVVPTASTGEPLWLKEENPTPTKYQKILQLDNKEYTAERLDTLLKKLYPICFFTNGKEADFRNRDMVLQV